MNRANVQELNARALGISLAVGWLILPFSTCAGAFLVLDDELGEWQYPGQAFRGLLEGKGLKTNITLIRYVTEVDALHESNFSFAIFACVVV